MKKTELISAIAAKAGQTKVLSEEVFTATFEAIAEALEKGEKIAIPGFGTFGTRVSAAREFVSPMTGENISVPEKTRPTFKAATRLKERLAQKA